MGELVRVAEACGAMQRARSTLSSLLLCICLQVLPAAAQVDPEVLALATRLVRPKIQSTCCCLDVFVIWVEQWATKCAALDSFNITQKPYEDYFNDCSTVSCDCVLWQNQRPVDQNEIMPCMERAIAGNRLSDLAGQFLPLVMRSCMQMMMETTHACGRCDVDRNTRGYCEEL